VGRLFWKTCAGTAPSLRCIGRLQLSVLIKNGRSWRKHLSMSVSRGRSSKDTLLFRGGTRQRLRKAKWAPTRLMRRSKVSSTRSPRRHGPTKARRRPSGPEIDRGFDFVRLHHCNIANLRRSRLRAPAPAASFQPQRRRQYRTRRERRVVPSGCALSAMSFANELLSSRGQFS
jgi:hypothetical protein